MFILIFTCDLNADFEPTADSKGILRSEGKLKLVSHVEKVSMQQGISLRSIRAVRDNCFIGAGRASACRNRNSFIFKTLCEAMAGKTWQARSGNP